MKESKLYSIQIGAKSHSYYYFGNLISDNIALTPNIIVKKEYSNGNIAFQTVYESVSSTINGFAIDNSEDFIYILIRSEDFDSRSGILIIGTTLGDIVRIYRSSYFSNNDLFASIALSADQTFVYYNVPDTSDKGML